MLIEDPKTLSLLRRMIARLAVDRASGEDLYEEALLHLWRQEKRRPGQKRGWYLRGCWLCVMNLLRSGRSLDCLKRRAGRVRYDEALGEQEAPSRAAVGDDVRSEVSARDLVAVINSRLNARERETLRCLAEGLSDREIARGLHLSHTAVAKRRRKIAAIVLGLGIQPPTPNPTSLNHRRPVC